MPSRPALSVLLTVAALGLTGCAAAPEPGTVTVLNSATDTAEHTKNQKFFDRCGKKFGLRVEQNSVPADQVSSKALRMASSHSLPDILELDGSELPQFAQTSGLRGLRDLGVRTSGLSRSGVSLGSFEGTRYGIARSVNSLALYYNPKLLKKADVEVPRTWDELRTAAKKLSGHGTYGLAFSASPDADGVYQFLPFFWSAGGDEARLDSGKGKAALSLWKDMVADRSVSKAVVNWNQQDVNDQFVAGRAAMMVNGPWQVPVLDAQDKVDWAVAKFPVPEADGKAVPPVGGTVMTVPKSDDSEREKNAAKILNCLNIPGNQLDWGEAVNNVPTRAAAARTYAKQNPKLAPFADLVTTARSRTAKVGTRWPAVSDALAGAFQSVLTGGSSPEAALRRAQRQATAGE
ncbi:MULTISPECIES: sugar ABC transporter substrate-binding protein [unclassified Streptomyces]|uniref:sugar ABC transporter substrate-binding protein n=1 Tax=unclassified Streptomyces TaxID=2593676 RepID=UPI002DDA3FE9|nr:MULTISPECIES: sugar ABC transporter substrate-binding protein [unclassified Streptomyces]WSA90739.1 sugar ABC transporter substrate-binding protein [Streptomyces sp. NBC_01795]WSB75063.1 sugar ABC transporter substrate-binding protein [Streptomyces sp. NBC_01775]WSS16656.1 sugar ABC transporter substrate-binding protein [Streptomyces sp. NBC_01186]WSS45474.1 sugar ABC transporter substrate-binding protein [Streptomyces sp. NBC_01187]